MRQLTSIQQTTRLTIKYTHNTQLDFPTAAKICQLTAHLNTALMYNRTKILVYIMPNKQSELRIIAGKWRSRKLPFYAEQGLRPTLNHMRETLFNWLQFEIHNKSVLDLFSGSGALALEALSRGAKNATLVELSTRNVKQLKQNLNSLKAQNAQVICSDARQFIQQNKQPYDIIFLDPPFNQGLLNEIIPSIDTNLKEGSKVYIEHEPNLPLAIPDTWLCLKQKQHKEFFTALYQKGAINNEDSI